MNKNRPNTHSLDFLVLWGLSIDIMLLYTVQTVYYIPQTLGPNVTSRTRISDIAIFEGTF